jgi:hypothetical protein
MSDTATQTPTAPDPTNDQTAAPSNGSASPEPIKNWLESLPHEMRIEPSLATIPDIPTLAKNYVETKRALGAEKIPKPQKNWDDKQRAEFFNSIGRPESPDKYTDPNIQLDEGLKIDPDRMKAAKAQFHKLGLTDDQAKGIMEYYLNITNTEVKTSRESQAAAMAAADTALRKEWGQKYDMNVELAKAAANKFAEPELIQKYGNDPKFLSLLAKVGQGMMEDTATGRGDGNILPTDMNAKREILKMKADPDFMNRFMRGDKAAVALWNEQHRVAYNK